MKVIGVIPARFASTRFPGKPLVMIDGMSMIQRVYMRAEQSPVLSDIIVATDDVRIFEHVKNFGGKVIMTSIHHRSGTERCAEILEILSIDKPVDFPDILINIQGDEPFIHPAQIDTIAGCFQDSGISIATLGKVITDRDELFNPNVVKLLRDRKGNALYFSRSVIPHLRGLPENEWISGYNFLKHIGIYAYRTAVLSEIVKLEPSPLELAESLEQLRWLENGYAIGVAVTEFESIAIDSPDDLQKVKNIRL